MKSSLSLVFSILLLVSCGKNNSPADFEATASSIIVGDLQWSEVTELSPNSAEAKNALAVAHVDLPLIGSRCTGFMVTEDVLMTNHHCIPTSRHAEGVTVSFEVVEGVEEGSEERFDCSTFIGNNQTLDFALLKCESSPGQKYGVAKLQLAPMQNASNIYVIQQNCDYYSSRECYHTKKISRGSGSLDGQQITHNADTLGGSSGSPVFSASTHEVVGIHHAGRGNNGFGRGLENYAVSMTKIIPFIKENFPSVELPGHSGTPAPQVRDNNTMEGATQLGRFKRIRGAIDSSKDIDYFEFEVEQSSSVAIDLKIENRGVDLDIYLVKKEAGVLGKSESVTQVEEITKTLAPGTYFVLVKGYRGAVGNYTLTVR